jgi:hypothetical protein
MDLGNSLKWPNSVCWQRGGAAEPDATYIVVLVANTTRAINALGFPVKTRGRQDEVRVPIPRCRACCARNRASAITALLAAAFGTAVLPTVWPNSGPRGGPPLWLFGGEARDHVMIGSASFWGSLSPCSVLHCADACCASGRSTFTRQSSPC